MSLKAFRLCNFMAYEDTGWIDLKPAILLFGENSSGKSVIIRVLRLLKQSMTDPIDGSPFNYSIRDGANLGNFRTIAHGPDKFRYHRPFSPPNDNPDDTITKTVTFAFRFEVDEKVVRDLLSKTVEPSPFIDLDLYLKYTFDVYREVAMLDELSIEFPTNDEISELPHVIFRAEHIKYTKPLDPSEKVPKSDWWFSSDFFYTHEIQSFGNVWPFIHIVLRDGFFPWFEIEGMIPEEDVAKDFHLVQELRYLFWKNLKGFLDQIIYLPPLRRTPQREYILNESERLDFKRQGMDLYLKFLNKKISQKEHEEINENIRNLKLGWKIEVIERDRHEDFSPSVQIVVYENENSDRGINIIDMGVGLSQILPIIVVSILAPKGSLIIVEQPELHLHPRLQVNLGNFFVKQSKDSRRNVNFLLETHSEHLFLRFRRLIVETQLASLQGGQVGQQNENKSLTDKTFTQQDIHAFLVFRKDKTSYLLPIRFGSDGFVDLNKGIPSTELVYQEAVEVFGGFFADDVNELMDITGLYLRVQSGQVMEEK